jgi:hypothetical protein
MRRIALLAVAFGFLVPLLASAPAHAQATRTWVSGVGDDVNPCSRTAPCKTFAGAISKTAAGGEINCLDPGGFGGITITKAMTLNCHEVLGSILVAGTAGVTINAGATDKVILRNLQITGVLGTPTPGTIGVRILSAASVSIEDCVITQFGQQGILDSRTTSGNKLAVKNTTVSFNAGDGIAADGAAVSFTVVDDSFLLNNLSGVTTLTGNNVLIRRSVLSGNSSNGAQAAAGSQIQINDSAISNNGAGLSNSGTIKVSNSDFMANVNAVVGSVTSFGNNRITGALGGTLTPAGGTSTDLGQQ